MKIILSFLISPLITASMLSYAIASEKPFSDVIKKDFSNPAFSAYSSCKESGLKAVNKQIAEKETQVQRVLSDEKLTSSQKKSKTSLLQKEINTLKTQKENINKKAGG